MKRFLFLYYALALVGTVQANSPGTALTAQEISDQATAESKSLQIIERQAVGRVRMTAPMQAMEALIGPEGMELRSVDAGGEAAFGWRLEAVGRAGRLHALENTGEVVIEGERVVVLRPQAIEEFTAIADGIRQDFVIPQPPPAGNDGLVLELKASGATLENLPGSDQAVTLRMADGRELHYHALRVTDATGQELPARMHAHMDTHLHITVDDADAQFPIRVDPTFSDADWTAIAGPDFVGEIRAVVFGGGDLYAAGAFYGSPDEAVIGIARWDGSAWSALGTGVGGVLALAWDAANGHLYAGGSFTTAGGNPANRIARWDGSTWSALGSGMSDSVHALVWDEANGHLYAGGHFSHAGGLAANFVARWDGSTWSTLGSGTNDWVYALAWDPANGHLFVGGGFWYAGDNPANYIARWDGTDWSALGSGLNSSVGTLAWDAGNQQLYAGGSFNRAGGNPANKIARWDGTAWLALGDGVTGDTFFSRVRTLTWDAVNGHLYVGGQFSHAGGNPASAIARWDGSTWSALAGSMNARVSALAWDQDNEHLFVAGRFASGGGPNIHHIARWDGSTWSALSDGMNDSVYALAWDAANGHLYAGGDFTTAGGNFVNRIVRWDGSAWSAMGDGMDDTVWAVFWDPENEHLYAGGQFTYAGGSPANAIARWDGSVWSTLGEGMNGTVFALAWDAANGHLYAGGGFTTADGESGSRIARWDGNVWSALGKGLSGSVYALAWDAVEEHLYAGGRFTTAGGKPANSTARWDGSAWSALGSGMRPRVRALVWDATNGHLYAGGFFTSAGGHPAKSVARWDGSVWSGLGGGLNYQVNALTWDAANQHLYAGGEFLCASGSNMRAVARWDGSGWSALDDCADGSVVYGLAWDTSNKQIYSAGRFVVAGGQSARIARLETRPYQDPPLALTVMPDTIEYGQQSTLSVTGGSGTGAVTYAVTAGEEFCSVSDDILTGIGAGTCTVTAAKAGDPDYRPSSDTVDVTVSRIAGTLIFDDLNFGYNGDPHEVTAHIDKEPESVCMSPIGPDAGNYTVTLTCEGINYIASGSEIANIAKAEQAPLIVTASPAVILAGQSSLLSVSGGSGDGEISLMLTDGAEFCELDANALTGLVLGTCAVTATKAGDINYHPASGTVNVPVVLDGVFTDRFEDM